MCHRTKATEGDTRAALPLHRKETYLNLREEQNRNWAKDSYTMGIQYAQDGQLESALKAYSQCIQIDKQSVDVYIARGCTFANMSKLKEAIADFRQALSLQPDNEQAQKYLESTLAQEEHIRQNGSQISFQRSGMPQHTATTGAFGPHSNLDNINELVLDTDELPIADNSIENVDNKGGKKKKKKKSKRKKNLADIDRYEPSQSQRDRSRRDRDSQRDGERRDRGRSRSISPERNWQRRGDSRSREQSSRPDHYQGSSRRRDPRSQSPRRRSHSTSRQPVEDGRARSWSVTSRNRSGVNSLPRVRSKSPVRRGRSQTPPPPTGPRRSEKDLAPIATRTQSPSRTGLKSPNRKERHPRDSTQRPRSKSPVRNRAQSPPIENRHSASRGRQSSRSPTHVRPEVQHDHRQQRQQHQQQSLQARSGNTRHRSKSPFADHSRAPKSQTRLNDRRSRSRSPRVQRARSRSRSIDHRGRRSEGVRRVDNKRSLDLDIAHGSDLKGPRAPRDDKGTRPLRDEKDHREQNESNEAKGQKDNWGHRERDDDRNNDGTETKDTVKKAEVAKDSKTDNTVYFMRSNIEAQNRANTQNVQVAKGGKYDEDGRDGKDGMEIREVASVVEDERWDSKGRSMEDGSRRDGHLKRPHSRSPDGQRGRQQKHSARLTRDRSHSRSRSKSETYEEAKTGGPRRRMPLPSQDDLRRTQAGGHHNSQGKGQRHRGQRNR
ncbi:hypothetical protein BGZ94_002729 [Podila epigama]|nr:hypothetical protein BGZ94_002729 [Podila epigama]